MRQTMPQEQQLATCQLLNPVRLKYNVRRAGDVIMKTCHNNSHPGITSGRDAHGVLVTIAVSIYLQQLQSVVATTQLSNRAALAFQSCLPR